jgi:hypothetical protein
MQQTYTSSGDQPRMTQSDLSRGEAPASLQYRVTSVRSMDNNRSMRPMGREGRR